MLRIIFDLDGTLCLSSDLDNRCFALAVRDILAIDDISTDWSTYPEATDPAIARHLATTHKGADSADDLVAAIRHRFIELIEAALPANTPQSDQCHPVPGAESLFSVLNGLKNTSTAIATGGWGPTARRKLAAASVHHPPETPLRTADDAHTRTEIIKAAVNALPPSPAATRTVYVGDGVWDLKAARTLGIGFLGLAAEPGKAEPLEQAGATTLPDLTDPNQLLHLADQLAR